MTQYISLIGMCGKPSDQARRLHLQEDGELAILPASDESLALGDSLANVYKLGERKWRRSTSRRPEACAKNTRFAAMNRRWRGGANVRDGSAD